MELHKSLLYHLLNIYDRIHISQNSIVQCWVRMFVRTVLCKTIFVQNNLTSFPKYLHFTQGQSYLGRYGDHEITAYHRLLT